MAAVGFARWIAGAGPTGSGYAPRRRWPLIVPVVLVHGAVLALVAASRLGTPAPLRPEPSLVTFDVSNPPSPAAAPKPVATAVVMPVPVILPVPVPAQPVSILVAPADLEAIPAGGCDLTDVVQSALRESPVARDAIAMLPVGDRSVANAVMIWDGHWIDTGTAAGRTGLSRIRQIVLDTVRVASPECRAQLQGGPRLIALPGSPDVTLALGSGRWRWDDLGATEIAMVEPARGALKR